MYYYNGANQLTGVSMTRSGVTQSRTFAYTGSDLISETTPEGGTVTYTYDGNHHVTSRIDALNQKTGNIDMQYVYNTGHNNGRVAQTIDNVLGETTNYSYDYLRRLTTAAATTWGEQYTYDGFGNLTGTAAISTSC